MSYKFKTPATMKIGSCGFPVLGYLGAEKVIPVLDIPMLDDQYEHLFYEEADERYWPVCLLAQGEKLSLQNA